MNSKLIVRISLAAMLLIVMTIPAMAQSNDCEFYFNLSDGSHEITLAPDDEVVVYLDCFVPEKAGGHEIAVLFDPDVVQFVNVTENISVSDWMLWTFRGIYTATDPELSYMNFDAVDIFGVGEPNSTVRCGDIRFKAEGPGVTTLYLGLYPDDVPNIDHRTAIGDSMGDPFDWVYGAATFEITVAGSSETFTKPLPVDWNLISLPLTATDNSVSAVLSTVSQDAVRQYNATTKTFEDATTMAPGTGYFVHVTTAGDWVYEGTSADSTSSSLKSGLNMIGVPNCTMDVSTGMGSSDYRYVARWNADDQKYQVYNPSAPSSFHGFTTMTAGEGYFVSAKSDDIGFAISCSS
jgi:hypothetical protein